MFETTIAGGLNVSKWGGMGVLGRQLWLFAGDSDRREINQALTGISEDALFVTKELTDEQFIQIDQF